MLRATLMAQKLAIAAAKTEPTFNNFVTRVVNDRVQHTSNGVVQEPDIKCRAKFKTREHIKNSCGVIV